MSVICGLKTNHDGCVALISDGRLVFSHEAEKSGNNPRHAPLDDVHLTAALAEYGVGLDDVDLFVVDGWAEERVVAPTLRGGDGWLTVAPYHEGGAGQSALRERRAKVTFADRRIEYVSYTHAAGHVAGTYCASPFAARGEDAFVLAWDGGMSPRLYHVRPASCEVTALGALFGLVGNVYAVLAAGLDPFGTQAALADEDIGDAELTVPGKAMAYAGLGAVVPELVPALARVLPADEDVVSRRTSFRFAHEIIVAGRAQGLDSASIIATVQDYLGRRLVDALAGAVRDQRTPPNLCFTGGCALNIVWNTALRSSGIFAEVWVPPFPNDAGSALGTAAAAYMAHERRSVLDWDVYRGQPLRIGRPVPGWAGRPCSLEDLAAVLHETGEPVVFLNGRAELGPRALGNRSILAAATDPATKDRLNQIKGRESYRPVAPVCLAAEAPQVFDPGTPDPYMLFTHRVRPDWTARIPAVVHVDGTARLQTVTTEQNADLARVLAAYHRLSGVPVLCNTSANHQGRGFFPDVESALRWGQAPYVWAAGTLYRRVRT